MKTNIAIIVLFLVCIGCKNDTEESVSAQNIAFDSSKWKTKQGDDYPLRELMIDDLVDSKQLKGIKKREVYDLLGEPTRTDKNYLFYLVSQQRLEFLPLHTKTLVLRLDKQDVVEAVLIHQ